MLHETLALIRATKSASASWPEEPYKGLNYFTAADAPLFTQRDEEVEDCATLLDDFTARVLLLHGLSGTGKSSFLRAGLIPRLQNPDDDGCRFFFLKDSNGEPLLVRATDDPVQHVQRALLEAIGGEFSISEITRNKVTETLATPPHADRKRAADIILAMLEMLTTALRDPLVLLIDQAEEVLTLPRQNDAAYNRRKAFFYLIEEVCHRRFDMRIVVSFRTEYYGQFTSFFRISPTTSLTSKAEPRAGLVDYLLRGLDDPERIAAAMRRPTVKVPVDAPFAHLEPPFSKYKFEYAPGVAERIAQDLVRHSGDASTLAVMQIVCKDLYGRVREFGRAVIDMKDYEGIGCVQGALDSHIETAIRSALGEFHHPVSSDLVNRWRIVLSRLVGRQEGGALTTLLATVEQLEAAAREANIPGNVPQILEAMAHERTQLLRRIRQPDSTGLAYSLGHDSLGPPLSLWGEKHGERLELEKWMRSRVRRWRRIITLAVVVVCASAAGAGMATYRAQDRVVTALNAVAEAQGSSNLRLRLLLLTSSVKRSDTWPWSWLIGSRDARTALRDSLSRAPVFGGSFPAGLNAAGTRLARIEGDQVIVRNILAQDPSKADTPPSRLPSEAFRNLADPQRLRVPPVIGFVGLKERTGTNGEAVVISRTLPGVPPTDGPILLTAGPGSPVLKQVPLSLPPDFTSGANFPPLADITGTDLRFMRWNFGQGLISALSVVTIRALPGPVFQPVERNDYRLNWDPSVRYAWRVPVLANDCETYALLGRESQKDSPESHPVLWAGPLDGEARSLDLPASIDQGSQTLSSVSIARGCQAALVRSKWSHDEAGALFVVNLQEKSFPVEGSVRQFKLPRSFGDFVPSSFPQVQSPLAAAPRLGGKVYRVAWVAGDGLAVVDAIQGQEKVTPVFGAIPNPETLLTGLDTSVGTSYLTMSTNGDFLLLLQQRSFAATPNVRLFDLRALPGKPMQDEDLERQACQIAAFLPSGNQLTDNERLGWFGDKNAPQPCSK